MKIGPEVLKVVDDFVSLLSRKAEMNLDTIRRHNQVGTVKAVEVALANEAARVKVAITEEQPSPRFRAKYRCSQCGEITRLALHPCFAGSDAIAYGVGRFDWI